MVEVEDVKRITEFTEKTSIEDTDVMYVVDPEEPSVPLIDRKIIAGTALKKYIKSVTATTFSEVTANKILALADENTILQCTNTSAITVTVPTNSSVAFESGSELEIMAYGTGEVKVIADTGVTINGNIEGTVEEITAADFCNINGQYTSIIIKKVDTNEWVVVGSSKAAV